MLPVGTIADANNRRKAILIICATLLSTLVFVAKTSKYPRSARSSVNRKQPVHPNHYTQPLVSSSGTLARKECAGDYEACGAIPAPTASSRCCNPDFFCYRKPPYFSQCRPRVRVSVKETRKGVIGMVLEIETDSMHGMGNYIRRIHEALAVLDSFLRVRRLGGGGGNGRGVVRLVVYRKQRLSWRRAQVEDMVGVLVRHGVQGMRAIYL